jgi:large subunit ribosomal protein L19
MKILEEFAKQQLKKEVPQFNIGDTVRVHMKVMEADKARIHTFEGTVIGRKGKGIAENFTVRKISFGEGVERVFPLHSPSLEKIEVLQKGKVKRAKLYYLRRKTGKETKVDIA